MVLALYKNDAQRFIRITKPDIMLPSGHSDILNCLETLYLKELGDLVFKDLPILFVVIHIKPLN